MKQQRSKKEKLYYEIDSQLASNNLIRKTIPQGPRCLLRAISDILFYNQSKSQELLTKCQQYIDECIQNHNLPSKLEYLYQNRKILNQYKQNPDLIGFNKVHLELISQLFKTKIVIYYLGDDCYLNSTILNNNYFKCLQICRIHNRHDPVYRKQHLDLSNQFRQYIYEKILSNYAYNKQPKINKTDEIQSVPKRKHKKSLSACDQLEFKDLQYTYIFKTPVNNQTKKSSKKHQSADDSSEEFNLLNQCGKVLQRKNSEKYQSNSNSTKNQKIIHHHHQMHMDMIPSHLYPMQPSHFSYLTSERMIQSERVLSVHSISPVKHSHKQIFEQSNKRCCGRLKFFDQNKNYGFIIMDEDNSDIFVHYDDLSKAGITKDFMRSTKHGNIIRFEFSCMVYVGKYNKSRKAVDLMMLSNNYMPF